jgi:hypothetical protein
MKLITSIVNYITLLKKGVSLMFLVELPQSRKIKRLQLSQTVLTLFDPLQIMKIVILGSEMLRRLGLYLTHHRLNTVTS